MSEKLEFDLNNSESLRERGSLFFDVGVTLEAFSVLEESLIAVFATASGMRSYRAAFHAVNAIRDFSQKLSATEAAVLWRLSLMTNTDSLADEWSSLKRQVEECSYERNRLAHFRTVPEIDDTGKVKWFLCPYYQPLLDLKHFLRPGGRIPDGVKKYDHRSIRAKAEKIERTQKRLDVFIASLHERGVQLPQSNEHQSGETG